MYEESNVFFWFVLIGDLYNNDFIVFYCLLFNGDGLERVFSYCMCNIDLVEMVLFYVVVLFFGFSVC